MKIRVKNLNKRENLISIEQLQKTPIIKSMSILKDIILLLKSLLKERSGNSIILKLSRKENKIRKFMRYKLKFHSRLRKILITLLPNTQLL